MDDNLLWGLLTGFLGAELIKKIQDREITLPDFLMTCIVFFCLQVFCVFINLISSILVFFDKGKLNSPILFYEANFLIPLGISVITYFIMKMVRFAEKRKKKS